MKKDNIIRKAMTFGADSLSIMGGGILSVLLDRPAASFSENMDIALSFIPVLLIIMALISMILKVYHDPIPESVINSMYLSVTAFILSLSVTAVFYVLINRRPVELVLIINIFAYAVFFMGTYRLAIVMRYKLDRLLFLGRRLRKSNVKMPVSNDLNIELLLRRGTVQPDIQKITGYIADSTVLVTGGAGMIGLELCSQLLRYNARLVIILDVNENKLIETDAELSLKYHKSRFVTCIGSIQDRARLREVFDLYRPQIVFHAASYKQGPILEANPQEALKNNVMGTLYMVEMAIKHRVDRFVLLSADTAFKPTTVMGASKRVAEMLIQRANDWSTTRFSAVRFGPAVNSCGSVVQMFKAQILSGGPVYVAQSCAAKYLMTVPEAIQLILETGALTSGGEIFTLDMGEPVDMLELAKSMILHFGLRPDKDIKIEFSGLHPSERNETEKESADETALRTCNARIHILKANENPHILFEAEFDKLCQSIDKRDYGSAFMKVGDLVPTFRPARI